MKRKLKLKLEQWFSNFLPYQMVIGGLRYYQATRENYYKPEEFRHYGKNVRIEAGVLIGAPERLWVGDSVGIGQACYINAVGGCHLGTGCEIGHEAVIITTEHTYTGGQTLPFDSLRLVKPVYIEDYVWIGIRALIGGGVRVGEGAIIAMGSVVLSDVPPLAIVAGNPAKVVMYRSKEDFERLKQTGAVINPYQELPLLKVPQITKRKYKNELKELGFDLSSGHDYFRYEKHRPRHERLVPVESNGEQSSTR